MEQEVIELIEASSEITAHIADRLYHIHIQSANVYPAMAFFIGLSTLGSCVDGSTFTGQLTVIIETRSMADLVALRKHVINLFKANKNYRFLSMTPDMESTSKKYYGEIDFKIVHVDEL